MNRNKYAILFIVFLFDVVAANAQLDNLKIAHKNRFFGQIYLDKNMYDSAGMFLGMLVKDEKYATPYDYINFSLCRYKNKDTVSFLENLNKAIECGVDSISIKRLLRKMNDADSKYLNEYITANYAKLRQTGWCKYDTLLIKEVKSIEELDQFTRNRLMTITKSDSNFTYFLYLQRQADSLNYNRILKLLVSDKFPGYKNCGAFVSLTLVLIHIGDRGQEQWEPVFSQLRKEVLKGNITTTELATIVDNHYQRGNGNLCSYYGQWTGRTTELCDCKQVNSLRAQIGLGLLHTEYNLKGKTIPQCYEMTKTD